MTLPNSTLQSRANPWPTAIIATLLIFASGLAAFITFAAGQPMDLVQTDYYQEEVRYQEQLDRLQRTQPWRDRVSIVYQLDTLCIQLPQPHADATGRIQFYRPSDRTLDRIVPLQLGPDAAQRVEGSPLQPGLWKIRLFWRAGPGAAEHYYEQTLVVSGSG